MGILDRVILNKRINFGSLSHNARQIGIALLVGLLLGLSVLVLGPFQSLGLVIGVAVLFAAFTKPEFVILIFLAFVSSLIPARFNLYLRVAGRGFFLSDFMLVLLLAVIVFKFIADKNFRMVKTPLDAPLLIFSAAVVIGAATAILYHGIIFRDTTPEVRTLLYYLIFFPVTNLVRTRVQLLRLIWGFFLIGFLVTGLMVLQAFWGHAVPLLDPSILYSGELTRFYHPGALAVYLTLMVLFCYLAIRKVDNYQVLIILALLALGTGLLLTLGRNILISTSLSMLVLAMILRQQQISRLVVNLIFAVAIASGLIAFSILLGIELKIFQYFSVYLDRLTRMFSMTIFSPEETLDWRWREILYAWPTILQNPILGIGLHTPYRPPFFSSDKLTAYIHNAYIWLWLKTGILGLISFLWLSYRYLLRGLKFWKGVQDSFLGAAMLGFTLAYLAMMFSNLVAPILVQNWSIAMFGVILGINEVIILLNHPTLESKEGVLKDV